MAPFSVIIVSPSSKVQITAGNVSPTISYLIRILLVELYYIVSTIINIFLCSVNL